MKHLELKWTSTKVALRTLQYHVIFTSDIKSNSIIKGHWMDNIRVWFFMKYRFLKRGSPSSKALEGVTLKGII